jgi:beta-lactamase regulating signal transducer with metallopeptidase domain
MLEWLILHTAEALALAGVVLVSARCLRLSPAARHALWLVVLVKLLMPPLVRWPWALPARGFSGDSPPADVTTGPAPAVAEPAGEAPTPVGPDALPADVLLSADAVPAGGIEHAPGPVPARPAGTGAEASRAWLPGVVGLVWAGGGVAVALAQLRRAARLRRLLAHAGPAPPRLASLARELAGTFGVRPPRVGVLPGLRSPLVWGGCPARLLWPEGLEDALPDLGLRAVLAHELAHLRRRDHWVGWLLLAGGCVWWWHPLFWFVRRRLGREAELACDAWVVGTLPQARRAYAEALLAVCQRASWAAEAAPALGVAGRRRDLERRLVMVMREKVSCRVSRQVWLGVGLLALLALPAWTLGQVADKPAPAAKAPRPATATLDVELGAGATEKPSERDKKLQELEQKLQALLKELQALRAAEPKPAAEKENGLLLNLVAEVEAASVVERLTAPAPVEVTLTRTTYRLPAAKAEALSKFLREHVRASVLETKVDGDSLTVTTTPEVQGTIGQFIALVQGKKPATTSRPTPIFEKERPPDRHNYYEKKYPVDKKKE